MSEPHEPTEEFAALLEAYQAASKGGDMRALESAALQVMAFACEQAEDEPSADLRLKLEAHDHEAAGDWQKAEEAYRQTLALAQAERNEMLIWKAHADLCGLFGLLGQKERALEEATAGMEAARRANVTPLLAGALETRGRCSLELGEASAGLAAANEMFGVLDNEKTSDTLRARALILRARCYAAMGEPAGARDDLNRAWDLLTPMAGIAMFASVQGGLAGWWEVTASLRNLDADLAAAADAWRKAVEYRRRVSQLPQLEGPYKFSALASTLHKLGEALRAAEDATGAEEAFSESREIRQRIGLC